ncbi:tetratricopeptide repeat protein [Paenibacillus sp. N4]|uniref:tetratricopeptide repeat protein n=1 Tax=Paenibacillus vietnamensis TaxID=2590547 RepID=UPI001CD0CBAE|nr:tetratricopeptide repeat protein [Paenibacillus vietnamensis]MCA0756630.1 tetratricopeptide repeat protein [Paenibacillus vietnamensis]
MRETEANSQRYSRIYQLMQWRKYKEASEEAMKLIREEPEEPDAFALMGHISLRMSNCGQALHWSDEALRRDPEHSLAWFVRTNAYYDMQNWPAAKEAIGHAQRFDPYEPHYYFLLSNISNRNGKFAEAKEYLLKGLDIAPENALYLANLSYIEALLRNKAESKLLSAEALRLGTEEDHVYLYLAWAAEQRGEYDEGMNLLKDAIRLDPDNKQIREEFLEALQKSYKLYRILLWPGKQLRKMKPWQVLICWIVLWLVFRPFVLVFIILYGITHWVTKLLVHVKVFGWTRRRS